MADIQKRDWQSEILLNAITERQKLNSIVLPGEPPRQKVERLDGDEFQSSLGDLMGRYKEKLAQAAEETDDKKKPQPLTGGDGHLSGTDIYTWSV